MSIGKFIIFEGNEGTGKSTHISFAADYLKKNKIESVVTREPGGTALGIALRKLVLHPPGDASPEPLAELLLYAADRAQHVAQLIRPALEQGHWVLSDRFSGSTLAYQGYGRELDLDLIQ